jgi:hypothetical protein
MKTNMLVKCALIALFVMGLVLVTPSNASAQTKATAAQPTEVKAKDNSGTATEKKGDAKTHKGHKGMHHKKAEAPK